MDHLLEEDLTPGDLASSLHAEQPVHKLTAYCCNEGRQLHNPRLCLAVSSTEGGMIDKEKAHRLLLFLSCQSACWACCCPAWKQK